MLLSKQTTQLTYFYYEEKNENCQYQCDKVFSFYTNFSRKALQHLVSHPVAPSDFFHNPKLDFFHWLEIVESCASWEGALVLIRRFTSEWER